MGRRGHRVHRRRDRPGGVGHLLPRYARVRRVMRRKSPKFSLWEAARRHRETRFRDLDPLPFSQLTADFRKPCGAIRPPLEQGVESGRESPGCYRRWTTGTERARTGHSPSGWSKLATRSQFAPSGSSVAPPPRPSKQSCDWRLAVTPQPSSWTSEAWVLLTPRAFDPWSGSRTNRFGPEAGFECGVHRRRSNKRSSGEAWSICCRWSTEASALARHCAHRSPPRFLSG